MPFAYLKPDVPASVRGRGPARLEQGQLAEAEYRARMYHNLGFERAEAIRRIKQNFRWEWELHKAPAYLARIDAAVDKIYGAAPARPKTPKKKR